MAKISTLVDAFTAATINTALWNNITVGTATLDTVNDLVVLAHPTVNGTINTFGTTAAYDCTNSAIYAEVGPAANGNGTTRTTFKLTLDANNSVAIRLQGGVFVVTLQTAGTTVTTTLATYDPNAHGWWQLREASGTWYADVSADGLNWTNLFSSAYSWSATALTFAFQTAATGTEAAGNVATIQRINSGLTQCGPFNVAWPVLEEAWAPRWNANGGSLPLDQYADVTRRSEQQSSTSRGKQYELDQVQAGTGSLVLTNNDGALDPDNASGPYAGYIQPAQPYRKRAQWPPTRNLLTQVQATGGDLGGAALGAIVTSSSGPSIFSLTDSTHGAFVASASAWSGGTVMQFSVPNATVSGSLVAYTPQPAVQPGMTYSQSVWVRNVTASTSLQVRAVLTWVSASNVVISTPVGGTVTLTGAVAAGWTQVTVTGTAPSNAALMYVGVATAATAAATCSVQVDGWQLEQAAAPSTWACPGVWNPMYAGFTDEWNAKWTMGGTYGTISPTVFDAFSLLSQKKLLDSLTQEINSHSPRFLYQLDDPAGSVSATDATGQNPAAPLGSSKYGGGTSAFGTAITAANTATGVYTGSAGTVLTLTNPNPGQSGNQAATFLSLGSAGIKGPVNPSLWTRMIAFRYTGPTPVYGANLWTVMDGIHGAGSQFTLFVAPTTGRLSWNLAGPTSGILSGSTAASVVDSNWHLALFTFDAANSFGQFFVDGVSVSTYSIAASFAPTGVIGDNVGCYIDPANGQAATANYQGDISFVAEFATRLTGTDAANLYSAWKTAFVGESTDARYARILRYAGYSGATSLQAGLTTSMGAADFSGQDALSALQDVVTTENGSHFIDRAGVPTFQARSARYNAVTPQYVFGEKPALGEWPYDDAAPSRDSTHLANDVEVTQASTGQVFSASSASAQTAYFPKTMTRTINSTSALECQDAANYLLSRYAAPVTRVSSLVLHPSANPAMWPVCLSLELGMRVRVVRRPQNAPAITVNCFVEKIDVSMEGAEAFWTLQCSPVDLTPYGVFASFHTTLHTTVGSGVSSVTINAGADSTNLAAAQIGQGQQLVLGQGTANVETVTVLSVAATSPGWTTAVVTLTAATTKGHTAGDVICEPLPAGVTNPTTWDKVSMFDSIAFAY